MLFQYILSEDMHIFAKKTHALIYINLTGIMNFLKGLI